jgi:hypothetical protein
MVTKLSYLKGANSKSKKFRGKENRNIFFGTIKEEPIIWDIDENSKHEFHKKVEVDKPRVYYSIFAGRQRFMAIHLRYTSVLLSLGMITSVHIWDFASNKEDSNFLSKFVRDTKVSGYELYTREPLNPVFIFGKHIVNIIDGMRNIGQMMLS